MTEQTKREIEIIPWVHSITTKTHRDVIKYLETLQKGAILFLEITPKELQLYEKDLFNFGKHKSYYLKKVFSNFGPGNFAYLDVIATCILRGIEVIPIDTVFVEKQRELGNPKTLEQARAFIRLSKLREKAFVRNVARSGISQAHVLCGAGHTKLLKQRLNSADYETTINYRLFRDSALIVQSGQLEEDESREIECGNLAKAQQLIKQIRALAEIDKLPYTESLQLFNEAISKMNLASRKIAQKVSRKLMKNKTRREGRETTTRKRLRDIIRTLRGKPRI